MLIPDVLALPLAEAIARLEAAEIGYTVADTQPPRRQIEVVAEKIAVECGACAGVCPVGAIKQP